MTEKKYQFQYEQNSLIGEKIAVTAPSNIALVKYWGKTNPQIPKNPSISFTLSNCKTQTEVEVMKRADFSSNYSFDLYFEGELKPDFYPKIEQFFNRVNAYLPFLADYHFSIRTSNTFPHSSGIASSASGLSALAYIFMRFEERLTKNLSPERLMEKASFLARLGSGSACRSLEGPMVVWGEHSSYSGSSNLFGIKFPGNLHPVFENFQDTILLVDKGQKEVSSTLGHKLMDGHPFATARFEQAETNMKRIYGILESGDLDAFVAMVESEALSLHAMMMTSMPYFILMKPNTLKIIERIWEYRKKHNSHVCFTLDAGANVHLLYPHAEKTAIQSFIKEELLDFCEKKQYINDEVGQGVLEIS